MPNVGQIISAHNKSVLNKNKPQQSTQPNCNCRNKQQCPLQNNCLTSSVVYQATVTRQDNSKAETYIGLTENTFKTRYNAHISSFKNETKRNATTLSEYIWRLKDNNVQHTLKWKIIANARAYTPTSTRCELCLEEKFLIIHKPLLSTLNKRNELASTCRHKRKHLLCNFSNKRSL